MYIPIVTLVCLTLVSALPQPFHQNGIFDTVLNPRNNPVANAPSRPILEARDLGLGQDRPARAAMKPRTTAALSTRSVFEGCYCSYTCLDGCKTNPYATVYAAELDCNDKIGERDVAVTFAEGGAVYACAAAPIGTPHDCNIDAATACGAEDASFVYYYTAS